MCVYIHVCVCVCVCVCVTQKVEVTEYVCIHVCNYVCALVHVCVCVFVKRERERVCLHACVYSYVYVCTPVWGHVQACVLKGIKEMEICWSKLECPFTSTVLII